MSSSGRYYKPEMLLSLSLLFVLEAWAFGIPRLVGDSDLDSFSMYMV